LKRTLLAASIATLFSTAYGADIQLNPVTASSYYDSLDSDSPKNSFRTPKSNSGHTQVISREEIEQLRPTDSFELLNMATGVVASPAQSRMGFSSLSIRGDTNFRWMIDGVYLDAGTAARIMRSIPVVAIEEVKVVRGSSALTLGPMTNTENPTGGASVNGFIVVKTRTPRKDEIQARVALESNHTNDESLWLGKKIDGAQSQGYLAALIAHSQNGSPSEKLDNGKSYNVEREFNKGFLKGGYEGAGWKIDMMSYMDDGSFQIPNTNNHVSSPGNNDWFVDPSKTRISSISGHLSWNQTHTTLFSLSDLKSEQNVHSRRNGSDTNPLVKQATNEVNAQHLNFKHSIDLKDTRFLIGGDYRHWDVPNGQSPAYYPGVHREEKTTGWFGQVEQSLLDGKLNLDASYREDRVNQIHGLNYIFSGASAINPSTAGNLATNNIQLPTSSFFSLGSKYAVSPLWNLLGRYGHTNEPLANLTAYGVGAAPLSDGSQNKWEIGLEGVINKSFKPTLNYFHRKVENEKTLTGYKTADNTWQLLSALGTSFSATSAWIPGYSQGNTIREGVEYGVSGVFLERSTYRLTWTHFTRLSGNLNGLALVQQTPKDIAEMTVVHGIGKYTLTGAVKYVSDYYGTSNGTPLTTVSCGYTRFDLGLGYDWKWDKTPMKTTVYGKNITDKKYETVPGVPDVGRILGIELIASFK
jgi:iron complex outermembrane receptor protein